MELLDLSSVPPPSERHIAVRLSPGATRSVRLGHPWVFDDSIARQSAEGRPGDLAVLFDEKRRFVAVGLYDPTTPLRVRVLHRGRPAPIDRRWLGDQLAAAIRRREGLGGGDTTGLRLVHGENDGLPGLVVDRYASTLVAKLDTAAWVPWLASLRAELLCQCAPDRIVLRLGRRLREHAEWLWGLDDGTVLAGRPPDGPVGFRENGLRFLADVQHGQKTGFFLDQRDNRARVREMAAGRRTLDLFAYTGAFGVYAASGGATLVASIEASLPALATIPENFALNRHVTEVAAARHTETGEDAFLALSRLADAGRRFELVIADPPSFARREADVPSALRAYRRLAGLALRVTAPGGVLVAASCSSRVSADDFFATVHRAAEREGRHLAEIARTGHPLDHPVGFAEGAYLKCLFATAL